MAICDGVPKLGREATEFVVREGQIEICCSVSYDALRRQAGVVELDEERARRLVNWYRHQLGRIALARYAAGDFRGGKVLIDRDDIAPPVNRSLPP